MKQIRFSLVVLGLTSFATSFASFDMCLVSDSGTNSVHRIDPITNTYLGSFGGGILSNPRAVAIDQALNRAYVMDLTSRVSVWDYNTGEFINSWSTGFGGSNLTRNSDGTLNIVGASSIRRFTASGVIQREYVRSGTLGIQQGLLGPDGQFYMSTRTGNNFRLERFSYGTGTFLGDEFWATDRAILSPGPGNVLVSFEYSGTVYAELDVWNSGPSSIAAVGTTVINTVAGIANGHGSMSFILGRDAAVPSRGGIMRYDRVNNAFSPFLAGTSFIQTPTGLANVVAPEPGSMLALGLGLLAMARRKRS
ncbi:MAG: PEP-CTERM sorting domain-containing protein [Chthonomonas sp.]|nr:PEP-CTERM sorting domain-containing protein [Chthonomonas sp.]